MGCYVETNNKMMWLTINADDLWGDEVFPKYEDFKEGNLPVVLVDNGPFQAAGVAFDKKEYERFTDPEDKRPKVVFSVPLEKLEKVCDIKEWLKEYGSEKK